MPNRYAELCRALTTVENPITRQKNSSRRINHYVSRVPNGKKLRVAGVCK